MDTLIKHPPPVHLGLVNLQLMMDDWDAAESDRVYSKTELQAAVDAVDACAEDSKQPFWQEVFAYVYHGETAELQATSWQRGHWSYMLSTQAASAQTP